MLGINEFLMRERGKLRGGKCWARNKMTMAFILLT